MEKRLYWDWLWLTLGLTAGVGLGFSLSRLHKRHHRRELAALSIHPKDQRASFPGDGGER